MTLPEILSRVGASFLLSACIANRTTIQSSWADPAYSGPPLDRIAVVALFETRAESLAFEERAAEHFLEHGVETVPAHEILSPAEIRELGETEIRERLMTADVDGVLIVRLIAVDERREYQAPTPYLTNLPPEIISGDAFAWYYHPSSSYYWFWRSSADVTGSSGYWIEQDFLIAETALFDNRNDRLLWTAKSETMDDTRFKRTSDSIVRTVARQLFAMDFIAGTATIARSAQHTARG